MFKFPLTVFLHSNMDLDVYTRLNSNNTINRSITIAQFIFDGKKISLKLGVLVYHDKLRPFMYFYAITKDS